MTKCPIQSASRSATAVGVGRSPNTERKHYHNSQPPAAAAAFFMCSDKDDEDGKKWPSQFRSTMYMREITPEMMKFAKDKL